VAHERCCPWFLYGSILRKLNIPDPIIPNASWLASVAFIGILYVCFDWAEATQEA
jgi:hypothetical protein